MAPGSLRPDHVHHGDLGLLRVPESEAERLFVSIDFDTWMVNFASVLRAARMAAGLTQAELGERAGVACPNVTAYESGRREPLFDSALVAPGGRWCEGVDRGAAGVAVDQWSLAVRGAVAVVATSAG